jgi:nucleoside-diphosphate-sugar epimerase
MILIIGGMGFIGLNTAARLLEVGEQVVITQHTSHRLPDLLKDEIGTRVFIARMDVTNPYEVFDVVRRHRVDSVINLMAPPARSLSTQADYHLYTVGLIPSVSSGCRWEAQCRYTRGCPPGRIAKTCRCR